MQKSSNNTNPLADGNNSAPRSAKEKQKPLGYVNWEIIDPDTGEVIVRSSKGYSLFDNEYLTAEDRVLLELATNNGGEAVVNAHLRVIMAKEKPDPKNIAQQIKLVK